MPPEVVEASLASIVITTKSDTFTSLGESIILSASGRSASGSVVLAGPITWTSSDASIVEIRKGPSNIGGAIASARANGVATIVASSGDVVSTLDMTVRQRVGRIILGKDDLWVDRPGDSVRIESAPADARGNPMNVAVSWSVRRPDVATIDNSGLVSAVSFGETKVEASADDFVDEVLIKVVGDRYFRNGDVWLRYDVDLPEGSGPFPAIVWVHGSGRVDRNAQRIATDPLVPKGIVVLRYDKRGVGESTGDYSDIERTDESSLRKLASDAVMGVRLLAQHPAVDEARIGIAGNSQGGWIAPLAAAQTDTVSYLMLWSGPTVSVGLEIYYSGLAAGSTPLDEVYEQLSGFNGIALYEPMPVLQSTTIPSIWLYGALDRSIPVRLDTLNMRHLQSLGLPYEYVLYESARHDLRDVRTGNFVDVWSDWLAWLRRQAIL